ncbi:MAG TPA: DUF4954 family protein [Chitinophagaceae bacterium]
MQGNIIKKSSLNTLGYGFVSPQYLEEGQDEYYLRNMQNRRGVAHRKLTAYEIEVLVRNRNTSDDWNQILVSDAFNPELVKNCKFYGLVRIGKLEPWFLEFSDLKVPVGLYNSTIISSDFGDNVCIDNVNYLSHYILGDEVIIVNVNELATTNHAKFGNGILKEGEDEQVRIWLEVCNENGGRSILPFNGMLPGDAWLWSKYRDDEVLMRKFREFTEAMYNRKRGYYGKVGDRTVIKNTAIIKDVWIGSDAYIKGANKLKNLTINSGKEGKTQIGEGCELVNGIMNDGCRAFYGVKAVRFIMASHSQLKYGARLINSYLGNNSTISCCEVLNSLIFPAHEQHHNNSFLCAAMVMGQSNIAAGATIGSNHNSRSPDGELVAGRGFWPGLCVSLKHNSKFASFTILAKGDYPAELEIPIPFSLVSNDVTRDQLVIMPAYWFMYNMYALARNAWKYVDRDKRVEKLQLIEYDYLAPDTINEIFDSLTLFEKQTAKAWAKQQDKTGLNDQQQQQLGKDLLLNEDVTLDELEICAENIECSRRNVVLVKVPQAYRIFRELVVYYGITQLLDMETEAKTGSFSSLKERLGKSHSREKWVNTGGQLLPQRSVEEIKDGIRSGSIHSWDALHEAYQRLGAEYPALKQQHALASLLEVTGADANNLTKEQLNQWLDTALAVKEWMARGIYEARAKDYQNRFRKLVYDTEAEMNSVLGELKDNGFIRQTKAELEDYNQKISAFRNKL